MFFDFLKKKNKTPVEPEKVIEFFKVRLGGRNIEIECLHRRVFNMCRDYLAKFDAPDFVVAATQDDIEYERVKSDEESVREGRKPGSFSDDYLETLAVYRQISTKMLDYDTFMMHGAAIAAGGKAYVFMAKSGTGKTTHINNWLKMIPESFVVNGDKPLIDAKNLLVYGTPWSGKENMNKNTAVPLGGLIILERGEVNEINRITFSEMLSALIQQSYRPTDSAGSIKAMTILGLLKDVPCFRLRCNMDPESALVSYKGVTGEN